MSIDVLRIRYNNSKINVGKRSEGITMGDASIHIDTAPGEFRPKNSRDGSPAFPGLCDFII